MDKTSREILNEYLANMHVCEKRGLIMDRK